MQQAGTSGACIPCAEALVVEFLDADQNPRPAAVPNRIAVRPAGLAAVDVEGPMAEPSRRETQAAIKRDSLSKGVAR